MADRSLKKWCQFTWRCFDWLFLCARRHPKTAWKLLAEPYLPVNSVGKPRMTSLSCRYTLWEEIDRTPVLFGWGVLMI
jgi:hypothetical protein